MNKKILIFLYQFSHWKHYASTFSNSGANSSDKPLLFVAIFLANKSFSSNIIEYYIIVLSIDVTTIFELRSKGKQHQSLPQLDR